MTQSAAIIVICNISMGYLLAGAVIFVDIYCLCVTNNCYLLSISVGVGLLNSLGRGTLLESKNFTYFIVNKIEPNPSGSSQY